MNVIVLNFRSNIIVNKCIYIISFIRFNTMEICDAEVIVALRNSRKAAIKYDPYFEEEGRSKEKIEEISSHLTCISVSPKALSLITGVSSQSDAEMEVEMIPSTIPEKSLLDSQMPIEDEVQYYPDELDEKELCILKYQDEWLQQTHELYKKKRGEYDTFSLNLKKQMEHKYNMQKKNNQLNALQLLQKSQEQLLQTFHESQKHIQRNDKQELNKMLQEIESRCLLEERSEEEKRMRSTLQEYKNVTLSGITSKIEEAFKSCDLAYLSTPKDVWMNCLNNAATALDNVLLSSDITQEVVQKLQSSIHELDKIHQNIIADVEQAQKKALEVLQRKEASSKKELVVETDMVKDDGVACEPLTVNPVKEVPKEEQNRNVEVMEESSVQMGEETSKKANIDAEIISEYVTAVKYLEDFEASLESFKADTKTKKYRMLLHKAVAINKIHEASGIHLKNKVNHLTNLLLGQNVECDGKYISCKQHPDAVKYCKNLLAEKIVTQGEEQVQSKVDFAFPIAVVAVALCCNFPDLWQLLLGHFYTRCPYLAPYFPEKDALTGKGFPISKGPDGEMKEITIYLKRMYGYAVLYAAILQTTLPAGFAATTVDNISRGWTWFSCTLNKEPIPDITAMMIVAMLEVLGHSLGRTYGRQFKKILHVLCKDYFPKIKQLEGAMYGPVGRLKRFLQLNITRGYIAKPGGSSIKYF